MTAWGWPARWRRARVVDTGPVPAAGAAGGQRVPDGGGGAEHRSGGRTAVFVTLVLAGAAWGMSQPLNKIAVSEGYRWFGLLFWQFVVGASVIGVVVVLRGRGLPLTRAAFARYGVIAFFGSLVPNSAGYEAARHLPAGILAMVLSLVPVMAFPMALAAGTERYSTRRVLGLGLGLVGVLMIALPDASLPDRGAAVWLPLALVAPFCYALEVNIVAKWGMGGVDPIQLLFGAALVGLVVSAPLALASGQFIDPRGVWGAPEWALVCAATLNIAAYTCYVWLVGRAGPSFAAQVSYLVTGFGVFWAMLLLGERFSSWVWGALALTALGVAMVQPRRQAA